MHSSYPVAQLRWIVEVDDDPIRRTYEPMAAFNVDAVAKRYADECAEVNPSNAYRVSEVSFTKFGDLVAKTIHQAGRRD